MATIELVKAMGAKVIAGVSTRKTKLPFQNWYMPTLSRPSMVAIKQTSYQAFQVKVQQQAAKELGHDDAHYDANGGGGFVDLVFNMVQGTLYP
jgi:hypothetical protein